MRLRLSTRLILVVILSQSVILFALVWNSVRLINTSNTDLLQQSIEYETRLLSSSLAPGLVISDRATIADVLALLKNKSNINFVTVFNTKNKIMAQLGKQGKNILHANDSTLTGDILQLEDGVVEVVNDIKLAGQLLGHIHVGYSLKHVQKIVSTTRNQNTAIGIAGLSMSAFITIILGLFTTRNLRKLELGTRALQRGELNYRIEVETNDEIGDLARSFNQLAEHLHETKDELQNEHKALERETRFMETLLNGIDAVVMEAKPPGYQFTYVSQEAENLLGYPETQWLEPGFWDKHVFIDDKQWLLKTIENNTKSSGSFTVDFRMMHRNGSSLWVRAISSVELEENGDATIRGLILDIMEQKSAEERILYLAEHDPLTGLINRRRFQEELERSLAFTQRYQQQGALLFVDLDQFKYINDSYGHQYGDEYLTDVSRRLTKALRKTDILGRLGGDEFGIIIPSVTLEEAETVSSALLRTLSQETIRYNDKIIHISASIGMVFFPTQGELANDLLAKADAAMYTAKNAGRGRYHIFSEDDDELWNMQAKIHWEERIRWALKENRFILYYQPIANLNTNEITHYEVLLRMLGADDELIMPGAFLDTAERFGLISEVDQWVITNAIKSQAALREAGQDISLAINISGRHFGSSEIMTLVNESIETYGADPGKIIFEVTETAAVENLSEARDFINALKSTGCRFALDDFGIGFSSFHYLRNLPVDFIKIDGCFVQNLHINKDDRVFVKAMAELAHGLGIICIAEFVENAEIVKILQELGLELGQGYHLAKPAPEVLPSNILMLNQATG